jgi:hypothetical protein
VNYVAKPVAVEAFVITELHQGLGNETLIWLEDCRCKVADHGMLARYYPKPGDYWVTQADGYEYINPKAVFERKYSPLAGDGTKPLVRKSDVWWIVIPADLRHSPGPFPHLEYHFAFWEEAFQHALEEVSRQRCGIFS